MIDTTIGLNLFNDINFSGAAWAIIHCVIIFYMNKKEKENKRKKLSTLIFLKKNYDDVSKFGWYFNHYINPLNVVVQQQRKKLSKA